MLSFSDRPAFKALQDRVKTGMMTLRDLFDLETDRFAHYSVRAAGLFLDYSKNNIDATTWNWLITLARESGLEARRDALFSGQPINTTEHRPALHPLLRTPRQHSLLKHHPNIERDIHHTLDRMRLFSERVRQQLWTGYNDQPITDVVHIGIGGSDLGPRLVCQGLQYLAHPNVTIHFVSNVDAHDIHSVLSKLSPATTLFIIASKTFTTAETMMNARTARNWMLAATSSENLNKHFVAVSANTDAAQKFGVVQEHIFPFWDWVGGRYSVWSAIGLPVVLSIGFDAFSKFLEGAYAMDTHFLQAPLEHNMPVILALVSILNRNVLNYSSQCIAPYHQNLSLLPAFLQQLEMESNGKHVDESGKSLTTQTSPIIWGNAGSNAQHSYFQLLHQGSDIIPVDFIASILPQHPYMEHHTTLLASCLAQSEALMHGASFESIRQNMRQQGHSEEHIRALAPHCVCLGNRPSNTLLMESLTPATLGALLALYEHKVFVQGAIWNINSFDQWGVELGKKLAMHIQSELTHLPTPEQHDDSTNGLIQLVRQQKL